MSRRKQSNPKPLLKSECQETVEDMTVERDNKDFSNNDLNDEGTGTDVESNSFPDERLRENSLSPKSPSNNEAAIKQSPDRTCEETPEPSTPKLRLNITLAADPALKPDAKDIKIIQNDPPEEYRKSDTEEDASLPRGHLKSPSIELPHRMKVFMCHPCGIGFSSLSTLEAHQTYYCSHRKDNDEEAPTNSIAVVEKASLTGEPSLKSVKTGKQYACTQCSYSADKKVSLNRHMRMHQTSPPPSSNVSNGDDSSSQQIDRYCSECDIRFSNVKTYRAHKLHYCSSRRTEGQCSTPKADSKKSGSTSPQTRCKTPIPAAPPQPFLALPTNPILIIPYSLVRSASLLPGPLTSVTTGISNPDTTCFAFDNGSLQPLATAVTPQGLNDTSIAKTSTSNSSTSTAFLSEKNLRVDNVDILKLNKKDGSSRETVPLDLSVRKSPIPRHRFRLDMRSSVSTDERETRIDIDSMMEAKENLSISSGKVTPEQIVCAPSLPNSPSLSPSPRKRTVSPHVGSVSVSPSAVSDSVQSCFGTELVLALNESNLIGSLINKQNIEAPLKLNPPATNKTNKSPNAINSPLLSLPGNSISIVPPIPNMQPQIYVKQGVSKCKECNIVFCKYENYLAHKQHYCSARNQEDTELKVNTSPTSTNQSENRAPPVAYHQLICAACGIKYTSLDNLRAHQTFYCPKGGDLAAQVPVGKEKCNKCKIIHEIGQQCPITQGSYKCPVCDMVSLSAADSRKHLETHGSVKAFRCSICRYKGNTLRGMRTHIRMHFDKKSSDFNEENYMSCILEEDGTEIHSTSSTSQDQHMQQQLFNCEICNYSSSYKGNVMRHMKLVHSQQSTSTPPSSSPDIQEDIENCSQNGEGNQNKCDPSITVKSEPLEPRNNDKEYALEGVMSIKTEPEEKIIPEINSSQTTPLSCTSPLTADDNSLKNSGPKYCQTCDIKFNYMNTYIAHKQFYCKSSRGDSETPSPVPIQSPALVSKNKENLETVL